MAGLTNSLGKKGSLFVKQCPSTFHAYILQNPAGRFYIGHTDDLDRRLNQHNDSEGKSHLGKYTQKNGPWSLVWSEAHPSRSAAVLREREIKAWKSAARIRSELLDSTEAAQRWSPA